MADKFSPGLGWCCRVIQNYIRIWEIRCCYQGSVAIGVRYVPVRTLHRSPVHPIEVCKTLAAALQTHTFTNDICNWVLLSGLGPPAIGTTHAAGRHVLYGFTGYLFMLLRRKAVIPMVCDQLLLPRPLARPKYLCPAFAAAFRLYTFTNNISNLVLSSGLGPPANGVKDGPAHTLHRSPGTANTFCGLGLMLSGPLYLKP